MARRTPLYERHLALGARMVDFGGFDMPLQYTSIREEHIAVRERAGLFDVCHMGEVRITGPGAEATVQGLVTNDASRLAPGGALYSVMCNEQGGIIDDVIVYRDHAGDGFLVVVNASRREADLAWMGSHLVDGTVLHDAGDELGLIAVQGPAAVALVQGLTDADVAGLRPFTSLAGTVAGVAATTSIVSRTGYTGEDGVEVYADASAIPALWDALLDAGRDAGLVPAGLGARDTLRLEAGLRLYGQDMDETTDPYSAALGWTVKPAKGPFIGSVALARIREAGPPRRTVGLGLAGRAIARHGQTVSAGGAPVGTVTSGAFSFTLGHGIAIALVAADRAGDGDPGGLTVDIRGSTTAATRVPLPFYRRAEPQRS